MNEITDAKQLIHQGRQVQVPFVLPLADADGEIVCRKILRVLPRKRLVALAEWQGKTVIAKLYFGSHRSSFYIKKETRGSSVLRANNIASPEVLLTEKLNNIHIILFDYLQPNINISQVFSRLDENEKLYELLVGMVKILAAQHAKGILQEDLHPDNFIRTEDQFFIIDTREVKKYKGPLKLKKCIKNLGELFAQIPPHFDYYVKQILGEYFSCYAHNSSCCDHETSRPRETSHPRESGDLYSSAVPGNTLNTSVTQNLTALWYKQLLKWQYRFRLRRERVKLRKIFRSSTHFQQGKNKNYTYIYQKEYETPTLKVLLEDPDAFIDAGEILKNGNTCTVAKVKIDNRHLLIKRYNIKNIRHRLNRFFRATRASRYWCNAHRLQLYRMSIPNPVALLEKQYGPFRGRAYYISEYIQGDLATHFFIQDINIDKKRKIVLKIKAFFELFFALHLAHGDMKSSNFIVNNETVFLIDLDSMWRYTTKQSLRHALEKDKQRFMQNWENNEGLIDLFSPINHFQFIEGKG